MSGGAGFLPSTVFPYFWDSHIHIFMRWKSSNIFMNHEMERLRQWKRSLPDLQGQRPVGQRPVHLHVQDLSCSFDHLIDFFMVYVGSCRTRRVLTVEIRLSLGSPWKEMNNHRWFEPLSSQALKGNKKLKVEPPIFKKVEVTLRSTVPRYRH